MSCLTIGFFALVPADFGLQTLHGQLGASAGFLSGNRNLEASLLKSDRSIQGLQASVERQQPIVILRDVCNQPGYKGVTPFNRGDIS